MGNPTFYYYPYPNSGHLETIDMEEGLGELGTSWEIVANDGQGINGAIFRSVGLHRQSIVIQRDRMKGGEELAHKFAALQNHLDRGYSVGFSCDSDKSWIAPCALGLTGGSTTNQVMGNPFRNIIGSHPPADGEYIAFETGSPSALYEVHKKTSGTISNINGGTLTLSTPISFSTSDRVFARYYRYWPILKRPQSDIGQPLITNEHGLLWNFSVRLVVDSAALFAFHSTEDRLPNFPAADELVKEDFPSYDFPDIPQRFEVEYEREYFLDLPFDPNLPTSW